MWFEASDCNVFHYTDGWEEGDEVVIITPIFSPPEHFLDILAHGITCQLTKVRRNLSGGSMSIKRLCNENLEFDTFDLTYMRHKAFEADLAQRLLQLQKTGSSSDLVSLSWCCPAMDVVIDAQGSVKQVLHEHSQKLLIGEVRQYIEGDSIRVLDMCCLLVESLGGLEDYLKATQTALKWIKGSDIHRGVMMRARHALLSARKVWLSKQVKPSRKQLSSSRSFLKRMGDRIIASSDAKDTDIVSSPISSSSLWSTVYGSEMLAIFILRLLFSLLSPDSAKSFSPLRISGQRAWTHSFLSLQTQVSDELLQTSKQSKKLNQGSMATMVMLMPEYVALEASLNHIDQVLAQVLDQPSQEYRDNLRHLEELSSKQVNTLQSSVARLQRQIKSLHDSFLGTRMVMVDSF